MVPVYVLVPLSVSVPFGAVNAILVFLVPPEVLTAGSARTESTILPANELVAVIVSVASLVVLLLPIVCPEAKG